MTEAQDTSVLVVDDESGLADLYMAFLAPQYDVRTATSGPEALQQCDTTIDVTLLDRRMPGMPGDEVLTEIRQRGLDCRVGMLSAVEPDVDIINMPFDDYRVKPVERDDIIGFVETLSERATYDEQSREFFSLASKKAALEQAGNDGGEKYDELVGRMRELREDIGGVLDELVDED